MDYEKSATKVTHSSQKDGYLVPKIRNRYTGKMMTVSSAVPWAGRPGKKKNAYCARTAKIKGGWKRNPKSKNLNQRRVWGCPYVANELKISEYRKRR